MSAEPPFTVHVGDRALRLDVAELSGAELLRTAGFEGPQWDLYLVHDDRRELVRADEVLVLEGDDRFEVEAGGETFAAQPADARHKTSHPSGSS